MPKCSRRSKHPDVYRPPGTDDPDPQDICDGAVGVDPPIGEAGRVMGGSPAARRGPSAVLRRAVESAAVYHRSAVSRAQPERHDRVAPARGSSSMRKPSGPAHVEHRALSASTWPCMRSEADRTRVPDQRCISSPPSRSPLNAERTITVYSPPLRSASRCSRMTPSILPLLDRSR